MTEMVEPMVEPVRNLSQAFEALCTAEEATGVPNVISPEKEENKTWKLHASLQRELLDEIVERISVYSILHDLNKEAAEMASKDPLPDVATCLVWAANEEERESTKTEDYQGPVMIDEEGWFLKATERYKDKEKLECPVNFRQAMGEEEVKTQLWKPSRSWWEAKSGKNPWIEPSLHNKRWRYLWPLIHYHKFCAKSIKKLKRHGIDVQSNDSIVARLLREDLCTVSDHLSSISLYGSDEWQEMLPHFEGWVDLSDEGVHIIQEIVNTLPLRPVTDYSEVDSPILRSQINKHLLKAVADTRKALEVQEEKPKRKEKPKFQEFYPKQPVQEQPQLVGPPYWYYPQGVMPQEVYVSPDGYAYVMDPNQYYYNPESYPSPMHHHHPHHHPPVSPYWAHLDQATLSMGLATPTNGSQPPKTPKRSKTPKEQHQNPNVQPLFLQQQYYGYHTYGPPSPATQFMMSPQDNRFSYKYQYGHSPEVAHHHRPVSPTTSATESESTVDPQANNNL